jgi:hypothetical protein
MVSVVDDSILFLEAKGHRFEGPIRTVTVECHPGVQGCLITIHQSSSGHRERLAVIFAAGVQLQEYVARMKERFLPNSVKVESPEDKTGR